MISIQELENPKRRSNNGPIPRPLSQRFWPKVEKGSGCWIWKGASDALGYGRIVIAPNTWQVAHRVSYRLVKGEIPEGLQLDHLCRNPSCVNPDHLEPVTCRENLLRGEGVTAKRAQQTHCNQGHEYTSENTVVLPGGRRGRRTCLTCRRTRQRAGYYRRRYGIQSNLPIGKAKS